MSDGKKGPQGVSSLVFLHFLLPALCYGGCFLPHLHPGARSRGGCAGRALSRQHPYPLLLLAVLPTSCVTLGESLCRSGHQSPLLAELENWVTSAVRIPSADTCWAVTGRARWVTCNSYSF